MRDLVCQAQAAFEQGDWVNLVHTLQPFLFTDRSTTLPETDRNSLVAWAVRGLVVGDFQAQWELAKILPRFGEAAIAPLLVVLNDDAAELEARWFAVRILGTLNHPRAIAALIELLQRDAEDDLSEAVAEVLADLGVAAVAVLTPLLADPALRGYVVKSLAQIRHSETIAPLLSVVDDADPAIRAVAIDALSSFHDPRVPPVLIQALSDRSALVRHGAIAGLAVRSDLAQELALVDRLAALLGDADGEMARRAALALGRLGDDGAIAPLVNWVQQPTTPMSLKPDGIRALGWLGSAPALASLQQLLADFAAEPAVQSVAIAVLGRWENPGLQPQAAQTLMAAIATPPIQAQAHLRRDIAIALGQLQQSDSLDTLIQLLDDEDSGVRLHAIAALKQFDSQPVLAHLAQWQQQDGGSAVLQQRLATLIQEWPRESP